MYFYIIPSNNDAMHHGVLGMKWGIRRHQPYSVVPRGSGKTGKEIGEAKKKSNKNDNDADLIKKAFEEYEKNRDPDDFFDSDEMYEASGRAYNKTVDWFKKNEPEFLESIIKKDGKNADFRMYHDFRKTYEGFEDEEWTKAEKEWNKKRRR